MYREQQSDFGQWIGASKVQATFIPYSRNATRKKVIKRNATQLSKSADDEEKRKSFLERNRQAALKCRQRKKQWLQTLQAKVEYLTNDNEQLQIQTNFLREEVMSLRTVLLTHKDCPLNKRPVLDVINRPVPGMPVIMPGINPQHSSIMSESDAMVPQRMSNYPMVRGLHQVGEPSAFMIPPPL
ncbi:hypothetical protein DFQ30_004287 [Apophysomyces sp. BC1015]|nr:hypothetical protein DFQ30_004287 [Apophysomyces sp. BC1015]